MYSSGKDRKSAYERIHPLLAIALKYEQGAGEAPKVIAKGKGSMAERILAIAEQAGVRVEEDPVLAGALERVEAGEEIPPELYEAVAKLLAYIYKAEREYAKP